MMMANDQREHVPFVDNMRPKNMTFINKTGTLSIKNSVGLLTGESQ